MLTLYSFDVMEFKGKRPQYLLLSNREQDRMNKTSVSQFLKKQYLEYCQRTEYSLNIW